MSAKKVTKKKKKAVKPAKKGTAKKKKSVKEIAEAKYGKGIYHRGDADLKTERVSWGCFGLDYITGGGITLGRITEIFGSESSGKSSIALICAQEFIKLGKKVYWIDVENNWDNDTKKWAIQLGVDVSKIEIYRPKTGEIALEMIRIVVENNTDGLVVLDSWAAVTASAEIEADTGDSFMAVNARLCNQAIRQIQTGLNGIGCKTAVLVINQTRATMTGQMITPGGRALKFACGVRIKLARTEWLVQQIQGEKYTVGQIISMKTVKNKTFPPYKETSPSFYVMNNKYGPVGVDNLRSMLRFGMMWGIVKDITAEVAEKAGIDAGYYYTDDDGESVRIGKDENQVVFQLNKPDNLGIREDLENVVSIRSKQKIAMQRGEEVA